MKKVPKNAMWIEPENIDDFFARCPRVDGAYDVFAPVREMAGQIINSAVYVMPFQKDESSGIRLCFEAYVKHEVGHTTHYAQKFMIEEGSSLVLRFYCVCGALKCMVEAAGTTVTVEGVPAHAR